MFANIAGWIAAHLRIIGIIAAVAGAVIVAGLVFRSCRSTPKLNEKEIQRAQDAIAKQDRERMIQVLAESDTKEAEIDSSLKQIEIDREAAKQNYTGLSNEQLAEELNRRSEQK